MPRSRPCLWTRITEATLALWLAVSPLVFGLEGHAGVWAVGLVQPRPVPVWHQNHIIVGVLLAMLAIAQPGERAAGPWRRGPVFAGRDSESKS